MTDETDFIDIQPWPIAEQLGHLMASVAIARRGMMEMEDASDPFEVETDRFELESWARLELGAWLTAEDFAILEVPVGQLSFEQEETCDQRLLAASTIAWAVRAGEVDHLPVLADGAAESATVEWAPGPWTHVRNVQNTLRLRSDEELAAERERWEIIRWRSELFEDPAMAEEARRVLQEAVAEIVEGNLLATVDNDIALDDGKPFSTLAPEQLDDVGAVATVRLQTLNWVCGFGDSPVTAPLFLDEED
jgi:hypothetical protein